MNIKRSIALLSALAMLASSGAALAAQPETFELPEENGAVVMTEASDEITFDEDIEAAETVEDAVVAEDEAVEEEAIEDGFAELAEVKTATTQAELNSAVSAAAAGDVVEITAAGTYTVPNVPNNITIKGAVDGVAFESIGSYDSSIASTSNGVTFENVTLKFGTENYHGFQHPGPITMNNCTVNGKFFSYGDMTFNNCTFNAPGTAASGTSSKDYSMWVYGPGTVNYNSCKFYAAGKTLNLYKEDSASHIVNVTNCEFHSIYKNKPAVVVKETSGTTFLNYTVNIKNCTTDEGFPALGEFEDDKLFYYIDPSVAVCDRNSSQPTGIYVELDGKQVYPIPPAKIGETTYPTFSEAFNAAQEGDIVDIYKDADSETASKSGLTIRTNGYKLPSEESGYYWINNNDGTYTLTEAEAKVIDTAKTTGATVTLEGLEKNLKTTDNSSYDATEDATYKVVIESAPAGDIEAVENTISAGNDTNTEKAVFDISVIKTTSSGTVTDISDKVKDQKVTLTLGTAPKDPATVRVYHVKDDNQTEQINGVTVSGREVTFTAPSFSTYAVTWDAADVAAESIAGSVAVVFGKTDAEGEYDIIIKPESGKTINRFMSTSLAFVNKCNTVDYEIVPGANISAALISSSTGANSETREYHFEIDGRTYSSVTSADGIVIGKVRFYGYGTLDFTVDKAYDVPLRSENIVNTAVAGGDNIVEYYTITGTKKLLVADEAASYQTDDEKSVITDVLAKSTKDLVINIEFPNYVDVTNSPAFQDMTVIIDGGDLSSAIVTELGKNAELPAGVTGSIAATEAADGVNASYKLTIDNALTANRLYNVTVQGAGYRTARYSVLMNDNKELTFWNNVMLDANKKAIESGVTDDSKKLASNFLAGDIVRDNNINIYDLSAVISYFGTAAASRQTTWNNYIQYDLNRDGAIDSKDIAYVLVSWGE